MEHLLDQSPIHSDNDRPLSSEEEVQSGEQEQQDMFDSETFKGSFLQEMEKLCRPLKYERRRHDIYAGEEDSSGENILAFIEQAEETAEIIQLDLRSAPLSYIIDFQADPSLECVCRCHAKSENQRQNSGDNKRVKKQGERQGGEGDVRMVDEGWRKQSERNWTSLTLKQYKQRIKKKLQQKR